MRRRSIIIAAVIAISVLGAVGTAVLIHSRQASSIAKNVPTGEAGSDNVLTLSDACILVYDSSLWQDAADRAAPVRSIVASGALLPEGEIQYAPGVIQYTELDLANFKDEKEDTLYSLFGEEHRYIAYVTKFEGSCVLQRIALIEQNGKTLEVRSPYRLISTFHSQESVKHFFEQTQKSRYKRWQRTDEIEIGLEPGPWVSDFFRWLYKLPYGIWASLACGLWLYLRIESLLRDLFKKKENSQAGTTSR